MNHSGIHVHFISGNIIPPLNFRKYVQRFIPPELDPTELAQPPEYEGETTIDLFGRQVPKPKNSGPFLWKMSYKLNNPQYDQVQHEINARKNRPHQHPPALTSVKVNWILSVEMQYEDLFACRVSIEDSGIWLRLERIPVRLDWVMELETINCGSLCII